VTYIYRAQISRYIYLFSMASNRVSEAVSLV